MSAAMTSLDRVLTTLRHEEPDRVPLFLLLTMHGAREVGMELEAYFGDAHSIAEGQLRLREKYGHDCLVGAPNATADVEAWGGEVVYRADGPPNAGEPLIADVEAIRTMEPPRIAGNPVVARTVRVIEELAARSHDVPIIGGVVAPFSLPIMQLGFETYLTLMSERPDLVKRLIAVNEEYCVAVANAQLAAGATAIGYADPMSSTTCVPPETYREVGSAVAARTFARIRGGVAINFASGRCAAIIDMVAATGAVAVQVGSDEDLAAVKAAARGRLAILGNLNGIQMRRWSPEVAETEVKRALAAAAPGGGFVLSDGHGEIPFQVPDETLHAIADAARRWGRYPIDWAAG
ncbi:MAG: uroporphyrinogen decarboxylase family protein [Actinomycetes bacterium]